MSLLGKRGRLSSISPWTRLIKGRETGPSMDFGSSLLNESQRLRIHFLKSVMENSDFRSILSLEPHVDHSYLRISSRENITNCTMVVKWDNSDKIDIEMSPVDETLKLFTKKRIDSFSKRLYISERNILELSIRHNNNDLTSFNQNIVPLVLLMVGILFRYDILYAALQKHYSPYYNLVLSRYNDHEFPVEIKITSKLNANPNCYITITINDKGQQSLTLKTSPACHHLTLEGVETVYNILFRHFAQDFRHFEADLEDNNTLYTFQLYEFASDITPFLEVLDIVKDTLLD